MNLVAVIGNVSTTPKLTYASSGRALCEFRIALSRPSDPSSFDYFDIVAWERVAEVCDQYLYAGRRIGIEGRLHHSPENGKTRIIANRVQLLGSPAAKSVTQQTIERED